MKTPLSKILGIAGAALVLISVFMPFVSFFGISVSLIGSNAASAFLIIALGVGGGALSYTGKKVMYIVGLVLGVLALLTSLYWKGQAGAVGGSGMIVMILGSLLVCTSGVMGLMKK